MERGVRAVMAAALATVASGTQAQQAKPAAGHWEGTGVIVVNWTQQRTMRVALDLAADGSVAGTVGDAAFRGRLVANRGALGRALRIKTDWAIRGDLSGPMISAESVSRAGASILFDVVDDSTWDAGMHSTGDKRGGMEKMVLSVARLTLRRVSARAPVP